MDIVEHINVKRTYIGWLLLALTMGFLFPSMLLYDTTLPLRCMLYLHKYVSLVIIAAGIDLS